jgi:hypothetical protein
MDDTSPVPATEPHGDRISFGPRWDALLNALDLAEESLSAPLTAEELERGWTEGLRLAILESVSEIKRDIAGTPCVQRNHYKSWIKSDMLDPRVEDPRWSRALGPDRAVRDIQNAEDLLNAAHSMIQDLPSLLSSRSDSDIQTPMIAILRETADTLASGDYVTLHQFLAWDEILTRCGVRRRVLPSPISTERHHPGINIDFIEVRPPGEAWDRIDAYDHLLVNHGEWDIIHHSSSD